MAILQDISQSQFATDKGVEIREVGAMRLGLHCWTQSYLNVVSLNPQYLASLGAL